MRDAATQANGSPSDRAVRHTSTIALRFLKEYTGPARLDLQRYDTMQIKYFGILASAALITAFYPAPAQAGREIFTAALAGDNEVPPINTAATATFHMDKTDSAITFSITFSGLS